MIVASARAGAQAPARADRRCGARRAGIDGCCRTDDDARRYNENGELIVDVAKLRKEPVPDPATARPSTESPGMEGGTAGTGGEHTAQNLPG